MRNQKSRVFRTRSVPLLAIHRDRLTDLQGYVAATGQPIPTMTELHHNAVSIGITALESGLVPLSGRCGCGVQHGRL